MSQELCLPDIAETEAQARRLKEKVRSLHHVPLKLLTFMTSHNNLDISTVSSDLIILPTQKMTPGAEPVGIYSDVRKSEHEYAIPDSHQRIFRRPRINVDNDTEVGTLPLS